MSIPLLLWLLSAKFLIFLDVHCAPKIGGILFEPIIFEAFESNDDDNSTNPTEKEDPLIKPTTNTNSLNVVTASSNETAAQVNIRRFDKMKYSEKDTITSTSITTSAYPTTLKKTTGFIAEINIQTVINSLDTTTSFDHSSADQNGTSTISPTTKKMMLYELLSPDKLKKYARFRYETTKSNGTMNFMGYNFDDTICRMVDDRVLCGYDSNPQLVQPVQTVEVGNECRLRGDRIECGYVNPPFDGIRRPPTAKPGRNNRQFDQPTDSIPRKTTAEHLILTRKITTQRPTTTPRTRSTTKVTVKENTTPKSVLPDPITIKVTTRRAIVVTTDRTTIEGKEHCVEKDDRIVCYDVKY